MEQPEDKRFFPRINAECPVLYLADGMQRWLVGRLVDFSATGVRIVCGTELVPGSVVSVEIKPGSNRKIPKLSGEGNVVRCQTREDGTQEVSIKMVRVNRPS